MSSREENTIKKINDSFNYILKDFSQEEIKESYENPKYISYVAPKKLKIEPYIVFIIFVYLKKYNFSGRWEKIAWALSIRYKGVAITYSHQKFGFRVSVCDDNKNGKLIAKESLEQIRKAVHLAEKLIEPYVHAKLDSGQVSVPNNYKELADRYKYFRKKAEHHFSKIDKSFKNEHLIWAVFNDSIVKATNYSIAMLDAYFSLLEHILVLIRPFVLQESTKNLSNYVGSNWSTKYKTIFNIEKNAKAKYHYQQLIDIKENYRNVFAHGNFRKEGGSFHIHMEHLGALPFQLTKSKQSLVFSSSRIYPSYYNDICKQLNNFDNFLAANQTRYGMVYIKSGLPVAFDNNSITLYHSCMTSTKKFEEFIHFRAMEIDNALNMDW